MKWALLSVWDKTGIVDLAKALVESGMNLLSSGGTGAVLKEAHIAGQAAFHVERAPLASRLFFQFQILR